MQYILSKRLESLNHRVFQPLPWISNGHKQTLAAVFWPSGPDPKPYQSHVLSLSDGDQLSLIENASSDLADTAPICVLVHGLTGSHRSNYMIRLTRILLKHHYRMFRLNLRGCGTGEGLARLPYHSGRSEDLKAVLIYLAAKYPKAPIHVLAFSLGANLALKMAGEFGTCPHSQLASMTAVSPPLDLLASVRCIQLPSNRLYDQYFTKALIKNVALIHQRFPDLPKINLPPIRNLFEFDDAYTAPTCGFKDAFDYYQKSSAKHYLTSIHLPTLILHSTDDPLVSKAGFQPSHYNNPNLNWIMTEKGGHVGFLGPTDKIFSYQWMDSLILTWLKRFSNL